MAQHKNSTEEIFDLLLKNPASDWTVYYAIAKNPNVTPNILRMLINDAKEDEDVSIAIAENEKTPENILQELFDGIISDIGEYQEFSDISEYRHILCSILRNKNASNNLIDKIFSLWDAWQSSSAYLDNVTLNPNVSERILKML